MKNILALLRLADSKQYRKHPPALFNEELGIVEMSIKFKGCAWSLFRHRRKAITIDDVHQYMVKRRPADEEVLDTEVGCVESHFLDSGSFTMWTLAAQYAKEHKTDQWAFYKTPAFWEYVDAYADFVKKNKIGIDLFSNVDVIPNAELSYKSLKYLREKHGLNPVPVVHYKTDLKWLRKYMDEGTNEVIALGGLVGSLSSEGCRNWIDRCFDMVCDVPSRLPQVKIHGFGVTNYELLLRYPWWSVDSTSWTKVAAFGGILVPHKRGGEFVFTEQPYLVKVSMDSPEVRSIGKHFLTMSKAEQDIVHEWLSVIDIPLGKLGDEGEVLEYGVITRHTERRAANLRFYEVMRKSVPEYPWPFVSTRRKGFGFV